MSLRLDAVSAEGRRGRRTAGCETVKTVCISRVPIIWDTLVARSTGELFHLVGSSLWGFLDVTYVVFGILY